MRLSVVRPWLHSEKRSLHDMMWYESGPYLTTSPLVAGGVAHDEMRSDYPYFIYWFEGEWAQNEILLVHEYETPEFHTDEGGDNFYRLPTTWILA